GLAATLFLRPKVAATAGVRIHLVRRAVHDIDSPAVGSPTLDARGIVLVCVGNAPVVFLFELVLGTSRIRIAPLPETLDELFPFIVCSELLESRSFLTGNNIGNFFTEPFLIRALHFFLDCLLAAFFRLAWLLLLLRRRIQDGKSQPQRHESRKQHPKTNRPPAPADKFNPIKHQRLSFPNSASADCIF